MTCAHRLLTSAPELALVDVLDYVLRTTLVVLAVQHPSLDDDDPAPTASLFHARQLARRTLQLRVALERYRDAVVDALEHPTPFDFDDIPF